MAREFDEVMDLLRRANARVTFAAGAVIEVGNVFEAVPVEIPKGY